MLRQIAFTALLLSSASAFALAAPATPEGAAKIKAGIETYLGQTPGVVTVTPVGEHYEVTISADPLSEKLVNSGTRLSMSPSAYKVTEAGNGKWEVAQDQRISLSFESRSGAPFSVNLTAARSKWAATYDETLGTFSTMKAEITDLTMDQVMTTPDGQQSSASYLFKSMTYDSQAKGTSNAVDIDYTSAFKVLEQTMAMPMQPGAQPQLIKIAAESGGQTGAMKGVRLASIKGMVGWFVQHATDKDLDGKGPEIRKMLNDALPMFDSLAGDMSLEKMYIVTPVGTIDLDKAVARVKTSGFVPAGEFSEALEVEGLSLPAGLVPPFAAGLVPQNFAIDFKLSDFNLAEAAKVFINELDTMKDKQSEAFDAKLLAAVMPSGAVTIATEGTRAAAKAYELSIAGSMKAGPSVPPGGKATIRLKGIDGIVKALQAAPPEMNPAQAVGGLLMAKGFGKADGDGLVWEVDATQPGSVLVNGIDVAKMGGAPAQ